MSQHTYDAIVYSINVSDNSMALYSYKKAPIKVIYPEGRDYVTLRNAKKQKLTLGRVFSGLINDLNSLLISSRIAGFFIPLIIIFVGFGIIYKQVWPDFDQMLRRLAGYYDTESVQLVAGDYVERTKYLSNPGAGYFKQLTTDASKASDQLPDPVSKGYSGKFRITIESLGLISLPVTANVDSSNDNYLKVLNTSLAHFQGTGLPISPVNNNIVIYGHSSSGDYYERTHDLAGAFSMLNKIKIGSEIVINMEGKDYKYRVVKSKIVQPNDLSIVIGTPGKRTLTLFTCFPNGNNTSRFVVVANPID